MNDELRHHIDERVDRLVEQGMAPADARRAAEAAFGNVGQIEAELGRIAGEDHAAARPSVLARVVQDVTFALRQLRRRPAFAVLAVGTLAIGIAASTIMFSLVKAVVLDPLPYPAADRLVFVHQVTPDGVTFSVSVPDFADMQDRIETFEDLSASRWTQVTLQGEDTPMRLTAARVTPGYFRLFGGTPILGRVFSGAPDEVAAGPASVDGDEMTAMARVALLGHRTWQDRLGGDPDIVGRVLVIDDTPVTVLGVMPAGWETLGEVWLPLAIDPLRASREDHVLDVHARLRAGVALDAARADALAVARALETEHPQTNSGWTMKLTPLKRVVVGDTRIQAGWVLLGAVGLLLLLACASVSNLFVARASTRGPEVGLRTALGASRTRLTQQFMTESLVVALAAAAVGVGLSVLALPLVRAFTPADTPRLDEVTVDGAVLLFALVVAVLTSLIFGLAPILHLLGDASGWLRGGPRGGGPSGGRVRALLVGCQVAITVMLLVAAGLLGSTFLRMQRVETGLPVETGLVIPLQMSGPRYSYEGRAAAVRDIRSGLSAIPGVAAVGSTNVPPFSGFSTSASLAVEGRENRPETAPFVRWRAVGAGWFDAVGSSPVAGRVLGPADFAETAEPVVVLGESLARRVAASAAEAVGARVAMGWDGTNWYRVVGVVPDVEDLGVAAEAPLTFYLPGEGAMSSVTFLVRLASASLDPPVPAIRRAIADVDSGLAVPEISPLRLGAAQGVAAPRFNVAVVGLFGAVALVLAVMGVYGVSLFAVHQRTKEIAIRIALGARPGRVVRLMLGRGLLVVWVGVACGALLALGASAAMQAMLFRTSSRDPLVLATACLVVGLSAALATWLPARRAGKTNPVAALRGE